MKRLLVVCGIAFLSAVGLEAAGTQDRYGHERPTVRRSTRTLVAGDVLVCSVTIVLYGVSVTSAAAGWMVFYNNRDSANVIRTTVAAINTPTQIDHWFDVDISSALRWEKFGTADVVVMWDYIYKSGTAE